MSQLKLLDHTGGGGVSTLYLCAWVRILARLPLFLINEAWKDYADSAHNWDTVITQVCLCVCLFLRGCCPHTDR